jgi:hypothetical protein
MRGSLGIDVWALPTLMTHSPVESRPVVGEHQRVSAIGTSPQLGAVGLGRHDLPLDLARDAGGPDGGRQACTSSSHDGGREAPDDTEQ